MPPQNAFAPLQSTTPTLEQRFNLRRNSSPVRFPELATVRGDSCGMLRASLWKCTAVYFRLLPMSAARYAFSL
jgi:hypothetical protein